MIISELFRRRILLLYFLLTSVNFLLILLPLTNSLSYEFSAANAIILFLTGGSLSISYLKNNKIDFILYLKSKWKELTIVILIPFVISFLSTIFHSGCPIKDGLLFYIIITIPAFIYGIISGFISSSIAKKYQMLIFFGIFVSLLIIVLIEFFYYPQIYFYNPLFGFFPGTIYDEDIAIDWKLILSQVYNLFFFFSLFVVLNILRKRELSKILLSITLAGLFAAFILIKPIFGFSTNFWRINRELSSKVSTRHFEIMFSPDTSPNEKKFISLLHEYYYDQVTEMLGVHYTERINSYIFYSKNQKRNLFGSANANVAKPWLNSIFVNKDYFPKSIKHELVHVIASKFGYSPFKVADGFNPALIEGMAMLVENDFDENQIDRIAKLAYNNGYKIKINALFSGLNFFSSYSSLAYIYSGAFLKYLYNEFGIEKIKKIYGNSDWEKIYGSGINTLLVRFEKTLNDDKAFSDSNKARLYFGGQTIFNKACPRMTANDLNEAGSNYSMKKYEIALEQYRKIYNYSNSYSALIGEVFCLIKTGKYSGANLILETQINKFKASQVYFNLLLLYGDTYTLMRDVANSSKYYGLLLNNSPHINYENEVKFRQETINNFGLDSLIACLYTEKSKRFDMLKLLNKDSIKYFTVPNYLYLASERKVNLVYWLESIYKKFDAKTPDSFYAAISISKYLLKLNNYELAKYYAIKALDYKGNEDDRYSATENLRMMNWFYNNADETKLKIN